MNKLYCTQHYKHNINSLLPEVCRWGSHRQAHTWVWGIKVLSTSSRTLARHKQPRILVWALSSESRSGEGCKCLRIWGSPSSHRLCRGT